MASVNLLAIAVVITRMCGVEAPSCCEELKIPEKCYFMCDAFNESLWSLNRLACTIHAPKISLCKASKALVAFKAKVAQDIEDSWEKLSFTLREQLSSYETFARASFEDLMKVPQKVFVALDTVKAMTAEQFRQLLFRFADFTSDNLRVLLSKVDVDVMASQLKDIAGKAWSKAQLSVIVEATYRKFGDKVDSWSATVFRQLGKLLGGLSSTELAKISASAFAGSVASFCDVKLTIQQKLSLLVPAQSAFGAVASWDSKKLKDLCQIVEALSPEQLLQLGSNEVTSALPDLQQRLFGRQQREAILSKVKQSWPEVRNWTKSQMESLGKFLQDLDVVDLKKMSAEQIKNFLSAVEKLDLDQIDIVLTRLEEEYGGPDKWPSEVLANAKVLLPRIDVADLIKLPRDALIKILQGFQKLDLTNAQADFIVDLIKQGDVTALGEGAVRVIARAMVAFSKSDVGIFSKVMLFSIFPELVAVEKIGKPVLRHLVRLYQLEKDSGSVSSLGRAVQALTRYELNETMLKDLLGDLEKVSGFEMDEALIATFMMKLKSQLGELNLTTASDADQKPWGFQNLKKIGKVALLLSVDELRNYPFDGLEDSVEVLGKQDGWKRRQVIALMLRMKEFWASRNLTLADLKENQIETLGKFAHGLTENDFDALSAAGKMVAIRTIGQYSGLPEDKLKSRSYQAWRYLKGQSPGGVGTPAVQALGNLVAGLPPKALRDISADGFLANLYEMTRIKGLSFGSLQEMVQLAKKHYKQSDVGMWTSEQWRGLGPAILTMSDEDLRRISKDAFDGVIDQLGELAGWSKSKAQVLVSKAKQYWSKLDGALIPWTGHQLRRLGALVRGFDQADYNRIDAKAFDAITEFVERWTSFEDEVYRSLARRYKEVFLNGNISSLGIRELRKLGRLVTKLSVDELRNISVRTDDILDFLTDKKDWTELQLAVISDKARSYLKLITDPDSWLSLKVAVKGFSGADLKLAVQDVFKHIAGSLSKVPGLSKEQKVELANRAKVVWGDVSKWGMALVSEAGYILGGLSAGDISKLPVGAVSRIAAVVLNEMDNSQLGAFTIPQLNAMDYDQADVFSGRAVPLLNDQATALAAIEADDPPESDPWTGDYISSATSSRAYAACVVLALLAAIMNVVTLKEW